MRFLISEPPKGLPKKCDFFLNCFCLCVFFLGWGVGGEGGWPMSSEVFEILLKGITVEFLKDLQNNLGRGSEGLS